MKNVIITGATGMIGGLILDACLNAADIGKVTVIVRRSTGIANEKLAEVIHQGFNDFSSIESYFQNQDIAYYCLGVYTGTVPREVFRKITVDYTFTFAKTFKRFNPQATFCFLSGMGADRSEKSRVMFAKDKGAAENGLESMKFEQLYIFRPAYIFPTIPRKEPNLMYRMMRLLYPVYKWVYPNGVITSTDLANAMLMTGLTGGDKSILENKAIRMASKQK